MTRTRIGVVGLGFGQHHVHALANMDEANLVAVADQQVDRLEPYARKYGVTTYRDGLEMLEQEHLDAVSLCVSPRWRRPLIEAAGQRGIPMFVEKPWAANVEQAREFAALCKYHHAQVMVGFSFRFLPAIVRLQELLEGELGAGWLINGDYIFDWLPPSDFWLWDRQNGGGYFNENSCHLFDAVCTLLGEPVSVFAQGHAFLGSPSEEVAAVVLRFDSGASAALTVGGLGTTAFRGFPRLDIITAHGQAQLSGHEHLWDTLAWTLRGHATATTYAAAPEILDTTRYSRALQHFIHCVQTGAAPQATIQHGMRTVAIAEAIYESIRSGAPVRLETQPARRVG